MTSRLIMALCAVALSACSVLPKWQQDDGYLVHVVLIWLKDQGNRADRRQILQSARVLSEIPGVLDLRVGEVVESDRPVVKDDYDVGLVLRFADAEALQAYLNHPLHLNTVKTRFAPVMERYEVMDFVGP